MKVHTINTFQFLMVRLKAVEANNIGSAFVVSIPYGSIKSILRIIRALKNVCFNSLWFD